MRVELRVKDTIEVAHHLDHLPAGHPCAAMHGHSYTIEIACAGEVNKKSGILVTYEYMQERLGSVLSKVDHQCLNLRFREMGNPTTENLCRWVWNQLHKAGLTLVSEVRIQETANTCCVFRGE